MQEAFVSPGAGSGQEEQRQCWVCLASEGALMAPCTCDGSMKWVHRDCLDRWRVSATNPRNFTHCRHCGFQFRMVFQRPPCQEGGEEEEAQRRKQRRRRLIGMAVHRCMLSMVALQALLFTLAALIRLADPGEKVVEILGLQHRPNDTFWDALQLHKGAYYLAAVLVFLLLVGIVGTIRLCSGGQGQDEVLRGVFCCDAGLYGCGDCFFFYGTDLGCDNCCSSAWSSVNSCTAGGCDICVVDSCEGMLMCAAMIAVAAVVLFVLIGAMFVLAGAVAWCQRMFERYMQLRELRELAGEYVVQDLSGEEAGAGAAVHRMGVEPAAPLQEASSAVDGSDASWSVGTSAPSFYVEAPGDPLPQRLRRELQAVYGLGEEALEERLQDSSSGGLAPSTSTSRELHSTAV